MMHKSRDFPGSSGLTVCWMGPFCWVLLRNAMPFVGVWGLLVKHVLKTPRDVFYGFPLINPRQPRFLEGVEINGVFLSAKEIYSFILESEGKKKKAQTKHNKKTLFAPNKTHPHGLLHEATTMSPSHEVMGRSL